MIEYTERFLDAGLEPSVGSVVDRRDDALAETFIGLFNAHVITRHWPGKSKYQVELGTLQWVDGFNKEHLPEPLDFITPIGAEEQYELKVSGKAGAVQGSGNPLQTFSA